MIYLPELHGIIIQTVVLTFNVVRIPKFITSGNKLHRGSTVFLIFTMI